MAQYKSLKEISEITGISVTSLRRGIKSGRYQYIRAGVGSGKLLMDPEAITKQLDFEALNSTQTPQKGTELLDITALAETQRKSMVDKSFMSFASKQSRKEDSK